VSAPKSTILAVDDAEDVRKAVEAALGKFHLVKAAPDARTALRLALEAPRPDLMLLDTDLGGTSGYDVCKAMRATPALAELPVIVLSDAARAGDIAQGYRYGAIDCFTKPLAPAAVLSRVESHLEHLARERVQRLDHSREQLVGRLARALELHSGWPGGNRAIRLAHYARVLAQSAGARDIACDLIMKAAPLYEVGKLGVPAEFLRKEALLQGAERQHFQKHPAIGAEIIGESDDPLLKLARALALSYRERWDGSGYPSGLKGNDIPWGGRIMAIVSQFEALTSPPYHRAPLPAERAVAEIAAEAGKQFDPTLVQALQKALPALRKVYETYADKQTADGDDDVIGGPVPKKGESEADRTLIAPLALRGTPVSDEARARMAGERAAAEDKAAQAARERRDLEQAAALAAEQRALAEEKLAKAAEERRRAEEAAAQAAEKRIGNEARAAGVDPKTQIALTRAQDMLAQLQKERAAVVAERDKALEDLKRAQAAPGSAQLEPLKTALAEKEKQLMVALAERDDALAEAKRAQSAPPPPSAELERAQAAIAESERQRAAAESERERIRAELQRAEETITELRRVQASRPAPVAQITEDGDVAIGAAAAPAASPAELERTQAALAEKERERAAADAEREAALAQLAAAEPARAAAEAARADAMGELKRTQAALVEAQEQRAAAEALRDEVTAELGRLESALAEAQSHRQRSDAMALQAKAELAAAQESLAQAQKQAATSRAAGDDATAAARAQVQKERAAAEEALAQAQKERRRAEELSRVQQDLTRGNEEAGRRIAEQVAQVRAERQRNEELVAQLQAGQRAAGQSVVAEGDRKRLAAEREAIEARAEGAARRRRQEEEAAARAAEERRDAEAALIASIAEREAAAAAAADRRRAAVAEAAAQTLARPAARAPQLAAVFGLGVLAAAAVAAAIWLSGVLEPAPRDVVSAPASVPPPAAESAPVLNGPPLTLRADDTLSAR
jgi:putative two-component system response regulator